MMRLYVWSRSVRNFPRHSETSTRSCTINNAGKRSTSGERGTEKNLNAQITLLQQELASAKQSAGKSNDKEVDALKKEIETLKSKHQKEINSAKEIAKAEMLTQIAILEKEAEAAKRTPAKRHFENRENRSFR